jgi:hypothetical protein
MSTLSKHIPFTTLADFADGRVADEEQASAMAHISACSRCTSDLEQLGRAIGLMRTDSAEDAPRDVVSYAVGLFSSRAGSKQSSVVNRLVAALSFDSFQATPAYGVRSGQAAATRQLLYSVGEYDLDLRITQGRDLWNVSGQLLGKECAGARIELEGEFASVAGVLNDQCEFVLAGVPTGSYNLRLTLTDLHVEIPELKLGA